MNVEDEVTKDINKLEENEQENDIFDHAFDFQYLSYQLSQ